MTTTIHAHPAGAAHFPPIPFARLLRAEWQKTIATRATRWLLAATAVTTTGALAVPLLFPHDIAQSRASYLAWAGLGLTRLLPVVLMLTMTAEWSQRTAMTTFTQEPRRSRVLAAKILTGQAICLAGAGFAFLAAQAAVLAAHAAGRHITTGWDWPQLAGFITFILLTGAIGSAFGALLHNTAVAIVTYFALAGAFSLLMIPALQAAGTWINTGQTYGWVLYGHWAARRPDRDLLPAVDRPAPDTRPDPHPAPRRALTNVTPAADHRRRRARVRTPTCQPEPGDLQAVPVGQSAIASRSDPRFDTESRPVAFGELLQKLRHATRAEVVEAHPARHDRDAGHLAVHLTAVLLELGGRLGAHRLARCSEVLGHQAVDDLDARPPAH